MIKTLIALLFISLTLLAPPMLLADETGAPAQRPVAGVLLDYPGELPKDVSTLVGINRGDEFSPKKVRGAIRLLYLKGIFEDIAVEGRDTETGVELVFHLVPRLRVSSVELEGNDGLSGKKVTGAMALGKGDFVEAALLSKSRDDILKLYRDEGFRGAQVSVTAEKSSPLEAELKVRITEGPPTMVSAVVLAGDLVLPEYEVRNEIDIRPGARLRKEDLENLVKGVTDYYVKHDYVAVKVAEPAVSYTGPGAVVTLNVAAGPSLHVEFEGNEAFSDGRLRKVLTFWEDRDASEEAVSENLGKISEFYKEAGYYFAVLNSRMEQSAKPAAVSIVFSVLEGPRVCLERIGVSGNRGVTADDILGVMELKESSVFRCRPVTDEAVDSDVLRIKALYESMGYLKAEVSKELTFSKDGSSAVLDVRVDEGPMTQVKSVELKGNSGVASPEIMGVMKLKPGDRFNPQVVKDDQDAVLNLYSQKGFIHAKLDVEKTFSEDGKDVSVVYRVSEGLPVTVGRIVIRGNEDTKDAVILRELLIKTGGAYDFEKILRSQQRIFKTGLFSQARIQPVNPDKAERVKDLVVNLKERDAGAVEFGVGYGDFDKYRGFAEVSYRNLFGLAHRVSLRGEVSTKEYKALVSYKWPWFMGWPVDFRANLVQLDAQKPNYKIKDLVASAGFEKSIDTWLTASVFYQYEKIKLNAPPNAVLAPEDKKKSNLASITPSVILDFRDNPFNPTKGSVHGLILKWASAYLGSKADFVKLTGQTSWYFPVYKGIVFGVSARGGIESNLTSKFNIPISERFFLGGASSLRGYTVDSVAPKIKGTPAGGDTMALMNAEVRFPLPYGFGIVGFIDAGNVWFLNKDVKAAADSQDGMNGLRYGAGIGLRYDTPVGPLRLDYAFKLNRLPGESPGELHFTLGQAF